MSQVIIGCKLPNGLMMEIVTPGVLNQPLPAGKRVRLHGANAPGTLVAVNPVMGAYGVTHVDAEYAQEWFKANADHMAVRSGAVFMVTDEKAFKSEVKDRAEIRTGLEPLNPMGDDPRMPQEVEPDLAHMKRLGATRR